MARIEIKREESEAAGEKQPEIPLEELVGGPVRLQQEVLEMKKEKGGHPWRKKVGNVFLASTILAGAMTGLAKKAEAGPHLGWAVEQGANTAMQRGAEGAGKGLGEVMERILGGGKTVREKEELERQKINQQNEAFRLGVDAIREDIRTNKELAKENIQSNNVLIKKYQDEKIKVRELWVQGKISDATKNQAIKEYDEEISKIKTGSTGQSAPSPQFQPRPERPPAPPAGVFERNPSPAVPSKEVSPQKPRRELAPGPEARREAEKAPTVWARIDERGRTREEKILVPKQGKFSPSVKAVEPRWAHLLSNSSWQPLPEQLNW